MCCVRDWHLYRLHRAVCQEEEKNAWSRTRNAVLTAISRRQAMEQAVNESGLTLIGLLKTFFQSVSNKQTSVKLGDNVLQNTVFLPPHSSENIGLKACF